MIKILFTTETIRTMIFGNIGSNDQRVQLHIYKPLTRGVSHLEEFCLCLEKAIALFEEVLC